MTATTLGLRLALLCASTHVRARQGALPGRPGPVLPVPRTGEDIYRAACVTCHGADGRGLLPRGFDKRTAAPEIAVVRAGAADTDVTGQGDRVRYRIPMSAPGTTEPRRFLGCYSDRAASSSVVVARASRSVAP